MLRKLKRKGGGRGGREACRGVELPCDLCWAPPGQGWKLPCKELLGHHKEPSRGTEVFVSLPSWKLRLP